MGKTSKYQDLSDNVVGLLGGTENVSFFTHCVTRLRFNIKDKSLVDEKAIDKLKGVVGTQWSGEQFQAIIGQDVEEAYDEISRNNTFSKDALDSDSVKPETAKRGKRVSFNSIILAISGCITPLLPMLIGGGMIRVVLVLLSQMNLLSVTSGTYIVLNFIADGSLYFLPVAIGYTGAKRFGVNPGLGILMGGVLIHPNFLAAVAKGTELSVFGLPVAGNTYTSSVFPMILTMFIAGYVERFFAEHSPSALRSILQPFGTLIVMIPLMLVVIAPIGSYLGVYLAAAVLGLYKLVGPFGVAIYAAFAPYLVVFGMHTTLIPYTAQMLASKGMEPIAGPSMLIRDFNQGIACIVIALKTTNKNVRATALTCATTAFVGGVTEPALFGLNLKIKKIMLSTSVGGFFGGLYAGFMGVARYSYGPSGIFGIPILVSPNPMSLVNGVIAIIIGVAITFITGMILVQRKDVAVLD